MKKSKATGDAFLANADAPVKKVKKLRLSDRVGANSVTIGHLEEGFANAASSSGATPAAPVATPAAAPAALAEAAPAGRLWTVTVALPGSVVDHAQSHELRSQLVGQIARACAIFNVDEIVVFKSETEAPPPPNAVGGHADGAEAFNSAHPFKDKKRVTPSSIFMARLLQYLECPPYLRKHIFPVHPDLRSVGLIAPLDAPHHLRLDEPCAYREAVVVPPGSIGSNDAAAKTVAAAQALEAEGGASDGDEGGGTMDASGGSTSAYTGLRKESKIDHALPVGTRVTLRMPGPSARNQRQATVVPPKEPREGAGLSWGFEVRVAGSLPAVWSECPFADGYDLVIGTSEHGTPSLHTNTPSLHTKRPGAATSDGGAEAGGSFALRPFRHALIVFGGFEGLEPDVAADDTLCELDEDVASIFDHYLNLCPQPGSRTIRTEEALFVGLSALKPHLQAAGEVGQSGGFETIPS